MIDQDTLIDPSGASQKRLARILHDRTSTILPAPESARRTRIIRAGAVLALLVSLVYLGWRILFTVDLAVWWVSVPLLVFEVHAFVGLALFTFSLWDVDRRSPTWRVEATTARIAVLIPTYNEGPEILLPTIAAALALRLPHETWVLDDGDRPWVRQLAGELGAQYLTRTERTHAKAGNVNHALSVIEADFIVILDADHVAMPDLLTNTLAYFDDPRVAVVQTPQDFYNLDSFEHDEQHSRSPKVSERPAYHEQALFYRLLQPGKNRWNAAFWCGTNAIVRVAALRDIGGIATETITEDMHTTIRLHQRGWKTIYHNEVLAQGLAACNAAQYMLQRFRWGAGAMQVLRVDNPLTARGLRLPQRLAYAATILGWFDAWRSLGYLVLPIVVLATGAVPIRAHPLTFLLAFGVTFGLQQFATRLLSREFYRPIMATTFELVRMTPNLLATLTLLRPAGVRFQVTPKGRMGDNRRRMPVPRLLIGITIASFVAACWFVLTLAGLTPLRYEVSWAAYAAMFWLLLNTALVISAITRIRSFKYGSERRRSVRFAASLTGFLDDHNCEIRDVSLTGAQVCLPESVELTEAEMMEPGTPWVKHHSLLTIVFDEMHIRLRVVVCSRRRLSSQQIQYGLEFCEGQSAERARLALTLFNRQIIPEIEHVPESIYS